MTKQEALNLMRLLSALETIVVQRVQNEHCVPDYIYEHINAAVTVLEREILG